MTLVCCVCKTSPPLICTATPSPLFEDTHGVTFFYKWTECLWPSWINGKSLLKKFSPVADSPLLHISSGFLTIWMLFTSLTLVQSPVSLAAPEQLLCLCLGDIAEEHDNDGLTALQWLGVFFCLGACVESRHRALLFWSVLKSLMLQSIVCAQRAHGAVRTQHSGFSVATAAWLSPSHLTQFGTFHQQLFKIGSFLWAYWGRINEPNQWLWGVMLIPTTPHKKVWPTRSPLSPGLW